MDKEETREGREELMPCQPKIVAATQMHHEGSYAAWLWEQATCMMLL